MDFSVRNVKLSYDWAFWQKLSVWILQCIRRCDPSWFCSTICFSSTFRLPPSIYCRYYLVFILTESVRQICLSITFRHNATKDKKLVDLASCSLIFKVRLLSQKVCMLAWPQIPWFGYTNAKKAWVHRTSLISHKLFVVSYSNADSVLVHSNYFCCWRNSSTQKYCFLVKL